MNTALWVLQVLLSLAFLAAGGLKATSTKAKLAATPRMKWTNNFTELQIRLIGLAEVLGAIGLVAPWGLRIARVLTPVAAACLSVIMVGAARTHLIQKEPAVAPILLGILSALVAIGRFNHAG